MLGVLGLGFIALELKLTIEIDYTKCYNILNFQIPVEYLMLTSNIGK